MHASISILREVSPRSPLVLSTPGELRQILANLIGNAIDAMRGGGQLRIRISATSCSLRVTIADSGIGITPEVFPTIFEPFVTTKGETGTGLGLWVTSEIIRKNGWSIRARSRSTPGRSGTVFSIVIPRLPGPSVHEARADHAQARA